MSTTERRLHVLKAIVVEHVSTNEPVSSKTIAQAHVSGVSSATIRSDMSALEERGLIQQPHTSAGRVPTEAGYRTYVDRLGDPSLLGVEERSQLEKQLQSAEDHDELIERAVRLLARLTNQAAVVEYPDLSLLGIRRVEVLDLGPSRLLVLVVSSTGRVAERLIERRSDEGVTPDRDVLAQISNVLTDACQDRSAQDSIDAVKNAIEQSDPERKELLETVAEALGDILRPLAVSRFATAGVSNLARTRVDFSDVSLILEVLEDQVPLIRVLRELHTAPVQVSIGAENQTDELAEVSLVSATYSCPTTTPNSTPVHVGVVGPTRMDYPGSLAAVKTVSKYLSELLLNGQDNFDD